MANERPTPAEAVARAAERGATVRAAAQQFAAALAAERESRQTRQPEDTQTPPQPGTQSR